MPVDTTRVRGAPIRDHSRSVRARTHTEETDTVRGGETTRPGRSSVERARGRSEEHKRSGIVRRPLGSSLTVAVVACLILFVFVLLLLSPLCRCLLYQTPLDLFKSLSFHPRTPTRVARHLYSRPGAPAIRFLPSLPSPLSHTQLAA